MSIQKTDFTRARAILCALAVSLFALPATALAASSCPSLYLGGRPPEIINPKVAQGVIELCSDTFSDLYSPVTLGPLAAAEHLTKDALMQARGRRRHDAFHPDRRLPRAIRTTLRDWRATGLCIDRGHMANNGDAPDQRSAAQTFALSNMIPQDSDDNERLWEGIENAVRSLTLRYGESYVVTGPIFHGQRLQRLNGRMLIPTQIYKAVYVPALRQAFVYVAANAPGMDYASVSLNALRAATGIDVFPALPPALKEAAARLPRPRPHYHSNRETRGQCTPVMSSAEAQR